jgi:Tfp pilus assembly protein PilF
VVRSARGAGGRILAQEPEYRIERISAAIECPQGRGPVVNDVGNPRSSRATVTLAQGVSSRQMQRPHDCAIEVRDGMRLTTEVEAAIILALRQLTDPDETAEELRIDGPLDEGMSSAQVYQGELYYASGRTCRVVIKVDAADRLANELECGNACKGAPTVARVLAPTRAPDAKSRLRCAAIIYMHAASPWPGPLRSLKSVVRECLSAPNRGRAALALLERVLGVLYAQLHTVRTSRLRNTDELDYYRQRWISSATVQIDRADRAGRRLYANTVQGAPEPFVLRLEPDELEASDGSVRSLEDGIGDQLERSLVPLHAKGQRYWGYLRGRGEIQIDAPPAVCLELATWSNDELHSASVSGVLTDTQRRSYARVLERAGLDPNASHWEAGGHSFANPLLTMRENAKRWRAGARDVEAVFSHGDLHGGNVLCVGDDFVFIDLGLAGPSQPRWVDAARLLGSLWRDALAPQLGPEQIAGAIARAFGSSASNDEPAAAMFLRGAFEAAIAASQHPDLPVARRELWIALHHFCWIALKWSSGENSDAPEYRPRVLAMAFLAAIAASKVDSQAIAIASAREDQTLADARAVGQLIVTRVHREHDMHAALTYKAEFRTMIDQVDDAVFATFAGRTQHLSAQCVRLLTPDWGERDVAEIEAIAARLDRPLTVPEEVLLVDILLLGCSRRWSDRAFGVLLQMCDSGDQEVMIEAYLAIYLLQGRPELREAIARHPRLLARFRKMLSQPEGRIVRRQIDALAFSRVDYDMRLFETIQARCGAQPIDLAWALRPFRADEHIDDAHVDLLRVAILNGLEESVSLSEIEKHVLARGLGSLPTPIVEQLLEIFIEESTKFEILGTSALWKRLNVRIGTLMQLPQLRQLGAFDLAAAARQMSRTLADIVEDEAEFRYKVLGDLIRDDCSALRALNDLCESADDAWVRRLEVAIAARGCEAVLGWLRSADPSSHSPSMPSRRDIDGLVEQLQAVDENAATDVSGLIAMWVESPIARRIFSSEVFVELLDELIKRQEWDATQLGNLAGFMETVRGEMDAAQRLYERAVEADPRNAGNLENFATCMRRRGETDAAQHLYARAVEADPRNARHLGNFADFMETVRGEMDAAQRLYERAIEADPRSARNLGNFANCMWRRGEMDAAQRLYERAVEADQLHPNNLSNFADFMQKARGELDAAERLYERAVEADPLHANNLGNFTGFLFSIGRHQRARELWHRARAIPDLPAGLELELEFYAFAHMPEERERAGAIVEQRLAAGVRSPGFDLSGCAARAVEDGHPEPDRVRAFAQQIATAAPTKAR